MIVEILALSLSDNVVENLKLFSLNKSASGEQGIFFLLTSLKFTVK